MHFAAGRAALAVFMGARNEATAQESVPIPCSAHHGLFREPGLIAQRPGKRAFSEAAH